MEIGSDEGAFALINGQGWQADMPSDSFIMNSLDSTELIVRCAGQFGPFVVTLRDLGRRPLDPPTDWISVVEISLDAGDELYVTELVERAPDVSLAISAEPSRLRISAGPALKQLSEGSPEQHFLIERWPEPISPPVVVRTAGPPGAIERTAAENEYVAAVRAMALDLQNPSWRERRDRPLTEVSSEVIVNGTQADVLRSLTLWGVG